MPGRVNNNLQQQGLGECADASVRLGWPPMGSCVPKAAIVVCSQHLLATVITVIAAAMAILVLRLGNPSDLLPHTACLPGSASHPPRARPECGETAKEVWREPATAEADIPEVVAAFGSTS